MTTFGELKEMMEDLEREHEGSDIDVNELPVMMEYDYGDRIHTRALSHGGEPQVRLAKPTAYSDSRLCLNKEDDDLDTDPSDWATKNQYGEPNKIVVALVTS